MKATRWVLAVAVGAVIAGPAGAQPLPIFDAHIHYSQPDWDSIDVDRALGILNSANVRRAIVSSTPDDGTLKLYDKAPTIVVPFVRPYRTRNDMATWPRDPSVAAYVEDRLKRGIFKGIGEFHMGLSDVEAPVVKRFAELAEQHRLFFEAHVDDATIEQLLTRYPRVRMIWAHAGMSASAVTVGRLVQRFGNLWVELSLRSDVAPGGTLDPEWRAVFLNSPDRFLIGTDTWVTSRWGSLAEGMREVQRWLAQLPRDVAEQIAYRNGGALFPVR